MVIKGLKHFAEINRMFDPATQRERFRYSLRRESSPDILYWGHEHTEEAAMEMANMYLNLMEMVYAFYNDSGRVTAHDQKTWAAWDAHLRYVLKESSLSRKVLRRPEAERIFHAGFMAHVNKILTSLQA